MSNLFPPVGVPHGQLDKIQRELLQYCHLIHPPYFPILSIEEFQGKIEAAREAGAAHDLVVVARTEALIADLGLDEALRRGGAYAEAGADLILIHSRQKTPDEIVAFTERWPGQVPRGARFLKRQGSNSEPSQRRWRSRPN